MRAVAHGIDFPRLEMTRYRSNKPNVLTRRASFEVAIIFAMLMYGRFRADSPQGVGCATSTRFHHPKTLANALIRIRALPDPLRGIGSVSLALTTRILEKRACCGNPLRLRLCVKYLQFPESRAGTAR